ncbi:hypothetical protein [Enterovibrio paralichthyis]|uniref:hypothetical protein n=1 Tax=Enterovibrio paralichthyis TaxID=2853805 RepID=UPI001C44B715|nr:hypothetical protein [Enterovibrio paralichthyis]MBV7300228.1 hypothetical protein [Enterovibrio paralichthyis]
MKFNRYIPFNFKWTSRKAAAAERKLAKERECMPLFAAEIAENQPSLDAIRSQRESYFCQREIDDRLQRAKEWRHARSLLFALPYSHRAVIRFWWNSHAFLNHEPHYLANMVNRWVNFGVRPSRCQIEKYGDRLQPPDFCAVDAFTVAIKGGEL